MRKKKEGKRKTETKRGRTKDEIRTRETNDGNDEPNIDPVKPVRLSSLYSPRAALLHFPFSPSLSLSLSIYLSISLLPSSQVLPLFFTFSRVETGYRLSSPSRNALGTDDFFECGPKIAHGNNYCGGFLLKITDLWITNEKDQEWAGVYKNGVTGEARPTNRREWRRQLTRCLGLGEIDLRPW